MYTISLKRKGLFSYKAERPCALVIQPITNTKLFTKVEVDSGGYLPSLEMSYAKPVDTQLLPIDCIRILGIELELACKRGLSGEMFSRASIFQYIPAQKHPLEVRLSSISRKRIWTIILPF